MPGVVGVLKGDRRSMLLCPVKDLPGIDFGGGGWRGWLFFVWDGALTGVLGLRTRQGGAARGRASSYEVTRSRSVVVRGPSLAVRPVTPASCTGRADQTGSAGGCLESGARPTDRLAGQHEAASAESEVRPGPSALTLRPYQAKTVEAGPEPEHLSTSSLPTMRCMSKACSPRLSGTEWPVLGFR